MRKNMYKSTSIVARTSEKKIIIIITNVKLRDFHGGALNSSSSFRFGL